MGVTYLILDVIREHVRSRLLYFYLVMIVVTVTAILLSTAFNVEEHLEAKWFSELMKNSAASHLERFKTLPSEGIAPLAPLPVLPPPESYSEASGYRTIVTDLYPGIPLWYIEMPGIERGTAVIAARGGMIEEQPGDLGITNYCVDLINFSLQNHPEEWPFPEGQNSDKMVMALSDGVVFYLPFLPENFSTEIDLLLKLALKPPVEPSEHYFKVLSDLRRAMNDRRKDPSSVGRDILCKRLFPGHRYSGSQLGEFKDIQSKSWHDLVTYFEKLMSPGRIGIIIASPILYESIEQILKEKLKPFSLRAIQPPLRFPVMKDPQPGIFHEQLRNTKKTSCVGGIEFTFAEQSEDTDRYFFLFSRLRNEFDWKLREHGLIYSGSRETLRPTEHRVAFLANYVCTPQKTTTLLRQFQAWLVDFPDSISDDDLLAAVNNLGRMGDQILSNPDSTVLSQVLGRFLRGLPPLDYRAEAEVWKSLSVDDARQILENTKLEKTIILGSVGPAGGVLP